MNQQQLQNARTALWHQNAQPLLTGDEAAQWLEETGLCLFLPRQTQLPAPAPSFVEACMGEASLTPPAAAITRAMEVASPLLSEGRAIPLNLLGTFSEQPDFLVTPEVLRWTAAVRGDRNWKSAPAGRTAPIVSRVWETLDREGEKTAPEIRAILGRELTEAAVLRALIELWSALRAFPSYAPGEATRWNLLKHRYPAELAAASSTAQTTALSLLASLYLRSAIAATAEEAEIFLSPLTARSRIREVVHGMTATRQFGSTTLGTRTLLFVEGTLEELLPDVALAESSEATPAEPGQGETEDRQSASLGPRPHAEPRGGQNRDARRDRGEGRTENRIGKPREKRPWKPQREKERTGFQRPGSERAGSQRSGFERGAPRRPDSQRRERAAGGRPAFGGGQRREFPGKPAEERGGTRPPFRPGDRKQPKPWQDRRREGGRPGAPGQREVRPPREEKFRREGGPRMPGQERPERERPEGERRSPQGGRSQRPGFFQRREGLPRADRTQRPERPRFEGAREERPPFAASGEGQRATRSPQRGGEKKFGGKAGFSRAGRPGMGKPKFGRPASGRPGPGGPGSSRSGPGRSGPARPGSGRAGSGRPGAGRSAAGRPGAGGRAAGFASRRFDRPEASGPSTGRPEFAGSGAGRPASGRPPFGGPKFGGRAGGFGPGRGNRSKPSGRPDRSARTAGRTGGAGGRPGKPFRNAGPRSGPKAGPKTVPPRKNPKRQEDNPE